MTYSKCQPNHSSCVTSCIGRHLHEVVREEGLHPLSTCAMRTFVAASADGKARKRVRRCFEAAMLQMVA
jgi:hypothetical protein